MQYLFVYILIFMLVSGLFLLIPYGLIIIFNKQFHTSANMILLNVVIWNLFLDIAANTFLVLSLFFPSIYADLCMISIYIWTIPVCGVIDSLILMSINQLCRVLYPTKLLFKKKKWVFICAGFQWILSILTPIPHIAPSKNVRLMIFLKKF